MSNYKRLFIQNSYLFLTINTYKRQPILINNIELLRESFKRAKQTYDFEIFASVVLPDHMHLILLPKDVNEYPKIIFAVKYHFSRNVQNGGGLGNPPYRNLSNFNIQQNQIYLPPCLSDSKTKKKEKGIWQRRFYEHTIRDEKDLYNHLDYIHYNPVKHGYLQNVKDWEYSSFKKFVKQGCYESQWGSYEDVKELEHLNIVEYD